jgi:alkanesulfonate monooxygenase SsuD/methylene tetrahydromethanopterin reductase-like flavin-dependent oxidoreductase (luciferase family)
LPSTAAEAGNDAFSWTTRSPSCSAPGWRGIGLLDGVRSRFGRTYVGEPDAIAAELAADQAVREADTVLFTVPNQLGVAYNARILGTIASHIAPAIGWTPAMAAGRLT